MRTTGILPARPPTLRWLIVIVVSVAMVGWGLTPAARASTVPRKHAATELGKPIPHLVTLVHGKLVPVRAGMKIGRQTVPNIDTTAYICDGYGGEGGAGCLAIDQSNILDTIFDGISAGASVFTIIWLILTRSSSKPDDDESKDSGENGGGDQDNGDCLTQAAGVPVLGACGTSGAVYTSATWILGAGYDGVDFTLENLYWYDKGDAYFLTTSSYSNGAAIQWHELYPGQGGQERQDWYFPTLI